MSTAVIEAPAVTAKAAAPAALRPPYQWAFRMHGFENAGRPDGVIDQCKDK
jgi:hypothetical protein